MHVYLRSLVPGVNGPRVRNTIELGVIVHVLSEIYYLFLIHHYTSRINLPFTYLYFNFLLQFFLPISGIHNYIHMVSSTPHTSLIATDLPTNNFSSHSSSPISQHPPLQAPSHSPPPPPPTRPHNLPHTMIKHRLRHKLCPPPPSFSTLNPGLIALISECMLERIKIPQLRQWWEAGKDSRVRCSQTRVLMTIDIRPAT